MLTADFFHVDCAMTLQRLYCLFVIKVGSRYAHILGSPRTRTGRGPRSRSGEGRLTLRDLLDGNLDLSSQRLAVLSACQTGITEFARVPDEVIGLPTGFLQAGVPGVVATLWPVNDRSTAVLVAEFYQLLLAERKDPATALDSARRFLRDATARKLAEWFERRYDDSGGTDLAAYEAAADFRSGPDPADRPYADPVYWAGSCIRAPDSGPKRDLDWAGGAAAWPDLFLVGGLPPDLTKARRSPGGSYFRTGQIGQLVVSLRSRVATSRMRDEREGRRVRFSGIAGRWSRSCGWGQQHHWRAAFLIQCILVWLGVWLVTNEPMQVPFIRWRFRGGRLV